ncbi:MAG: D-glycero-beta-D-manno-heptose 1-phosphate adenylyltransferase [Acidobacteriota bacterium]
MVSKETRSGTKKFLSLHRLLPIVRRLRCKKKKIVFTNGCFDLIHAGHIHLLRKGSKMGDVMIVGINTDSSVRRLKGPGRPIIPLRERVAVLAALECVDYVVSFREDTPAVLIQKILPDVLIKGGDWKISKIVGRDVVEGRGGRVISIPLKNGQSTSVLIERIIHRFANEG